MSKCRNIEFATLADIARAIARTDVIVAMRLTADRYIG